MIGTIGARIFREIFPPTTALTKVDTSDLREKHELQIPLTQHADPKRYILPYKITAITKVHVGVELRTGGKKNRKAPLFEISADLVCFLCAYEFFTGLDRD